MFLIKEVCYLILKKKRKISTLRIDKTSVFPTYRTLNRISELLSQTKKHFTEQKWFRRYIPGQKCDSHMRIAGED